MFVSLFAAVMHSTAMAAPLKLSIDAGGETPGLVDMLEREPIDWTITPSPRAVADLRLVVAERGTRWNVTVRADDDVLVNRTVSFADGREPARRVVVLLAVRAAELYRALQESPPPIRVPRYSVGLGMEGTLWWSPARPQLGLHLSGRWFDGALRWTGRALVSGVPCCPRDVKGIESDAQIYAVLAGIEWLAWSGRTWSWVLTGELGVGYTRLRAQPTVFQGPTSAQRLTRVAGLARAGLGLSLQTGRLESVVRVGAVGQIPPVSVALPAEYSADRIRTGVVRPWVGLEFHVVLFE